MSSPQLDNLTPGARTPLQRYWRFYWPLSFMSVAMFSGRLVQNWVLLHYEAGERELAVFALALALFNPFRATLAFAPQLANVLVRGPKSFRASLTFLVSTSLVFSVPILLLAWTPLGPLIVPALYNVSDADIRLILLYLRYLAPLVLMGGAARFFEGLLMQAERTGIVSLLRVGNLALLVGVLVLGMWQKWDPVTTLSVSLLVPAAAHLLATGALMLAFRVRHDASEDQPLRQREIAAFFLPMVLTTIMFTLTRPIIFAFLTTLNPRGDPALPSVETLIAAVSLALSVNMLFQANLNQFRNLFVTFGRQDRRGVRRFMVRATGCIAALMTLVVATPVARLFLQHLQGATGETLDMAVDALWVLLLVPPVVGCRNYFHGLAMVRRRTGSMAAGATMRNVSILACAPVLLRLGWYNHVTAAAMMVTGFAAEAATVGLLALRRRR